MVSVESLRSRQFKNRHLNKACTLKKKQSQILTRLYPQSHLQHFEQRHLVFKMTSRLDLTRLSRPPGLATTYCELWCKQGRG